MFWIRNNKKTNTMTTTTTKYHLFLTQFWPNFNVRFLWPTKTSTTFLGCDSIELNLVIHISCLFEIPQNYVANYMPIPDPPRNLVPLLYDSHAVCCMHLLSVYRSFNLVGICTYDLRVMEPLLYNWSYSGTFKQVFLRSLLEQLLQLTLS